MYVPTVAVMHCMQYRQGSPVALHYVRTHCGRDALYAVQAGVTCGTPLRTYPLWPRCTVCSTGRGHLWHSTTYVPTVAAMHCMQYRQGSPVALHYVRTHCGRDALYAVQAGVTCGTPLRTYPLWPRCTVCSTGRGHLWHSTTYVPTVAAMHCMQYRQGSPVALHYVRTHCGRDALYAVQAGVTCGTPLRTYPLWPRCTVCSTGRGHLWHSTTYVPTVVAMHCMQYRQGSPVALHYVRTHCGRDALYAVQAGVTCGTPLRTYPLWPRCTVCSTGRGHLWHSTTYVPTVAAMHCMKYRQGSPVALHYVRTHCGRDALYAVQAGVTCGTPLRTYPLWPRCTVCSTGRGHLWHSTTYVPTVVVMHCMQYRQGSPVALHYVRTHCGRDALYAV